MTTKSNNFYRVAVKRAIHSVRGWFYRKRWNLDLPARSIVSFMHRNGYAVIENFFDADICSAMKIKLISTLDRNPSMLHPATKYDLRLHGIENVESCFLNFSNHKKLSNIASAYLGREAITAFTLGANLLSESGNPGSGGGWHRDNYSCQVKALLYLSDVDEQHGPFQIISRSHRLRNIMQDNYIVRKQYSEVRLRVEEIDEILGETGQSRLCTFTAKAGTLVLFDSSAIHRGAPILKGQRMALTNYYYPINEIQLSLYKHFSPVAGH